MLRNASRGSIALGVLALLLISARASAAPIDIFWAGWTQNQLLIRVDPGISVGYVSLALEHATSFVPSATTSVSFLDSVLDASQGFVIIVSPYGVPLVPGGANFVSLGTLLYSSRPRTCGPLSSDPATPCTGGLREDLDMLGPVVLDIYGNPIASSVSVPEASLLLLLGLGLCGLVAARLGRAGRGLALGAAMLALSAPASAAPVDVEYNVTSRELMLRVDPGISVGYVSLVIDGAISFTPSPLLNISIPDSFLDVSQGFVILVSPYNEPLVPAGARTTLGTLDFTVLPGDSCWPGMVCPFIRQDLELLGPAILDLSGVAIPSSLPEPPAPALAGPGLAALALSRLAGRRAGAARPPRWPRAA